MTSLIRVFDADNIFFIPFMLSWHENFATYAWFRLRTYHWLLFRFACNKMCTRQLVTTNLYDMYVRTALNTSAPISWWVDVKKKTSICLSWPCRLRRKLSWLTAVTSLFTRWILVDRQYWWFEVTRITDTRQCFEYFPIVSSQSVSLPLHIPTMMIYFNFITTVNICLPWWPLPVTGQYIWNCSIGLGDFYV